MRLHPLHAVAQCDWLICRVAGRNHSIQLLCTITSDQRRKLSLAVWACYWIVLWTAALYAVLKVELLEKIMKSEDEPWSCFRFIFLLQHFLLLARVAHTLLGEIRAEARSAKWREVCQIHSNILSHSYS